MDCPSCKTPLPERARFCLECGATVQDNTKAQQVDPVRETLKVALGRQYEVLGLLGKGGMGAVYLATEAALEREVAIKVLPPDRGATKDSRDRFRREARTAAKLSHPNIVPLYTFGDVDGTLYFVMGYVKGESLAARLKREGRLSVEESRRLLIEIAEALDYAHKLGVIHRDIKPDNVLLEEGTGRAMLTDFGVAKALGAGQTMTEVGSVLGTPHYMSPEQAQGNSDIDQRADIYSLGVMGYAMLAGRLPFEGPTAGDIMAQHITKEAPPLGRLAPETPDDVAAALTRCLAKDPAQRWHTAGALRSALTDAEEEDVPIQLESVSNLFVQILICAVLLWWIAAWWIGGGSVGEISEIFLVVPPLLLVTGVGLAALLTSRIRRLRRSGFAEARTQYAAFGQPRWWLGFYPRRHRAPGDVWDRLPVELRRARSLLALTVMLLFVALIPNMFSVIGFYQYHSLHRAPQLIQGRMVDRGVYPYPRAVRDTVTDAVLAAFLLSAAAAFFSLWRWGRLARRTLPDPEFRGYMLVTWTGKRSFWRQPQIAPLLSPKGGVSQKASTTEPKTAADLADAVAAVARGLPEPARDVGAQALATARYLADSIASLDRQALGLEGAIDPAETGRLSARIVALGPGAAADSDRWEILEILQKQLDAVRGLEARLEAIKSRRSKCSELLRSLWVHCAGLQAASGERQNGPETDRLRRLVSEIGERAGTPTLGSDGDVTQARSDAATLQR